MAATISVQYPMFGATVGVDVVPFIVFSAGVNSGSIVFNITDVNNAVVPTTPSYNSGIFTYTIVPNQSLAFNSSFNAVFASGRDLTNAQIAPSSWPFNTTIFHQFAGWGWGASC
jgi:hypothetical protein